MDDPLLLWSRVLRGMAVVLLLCLLLSWPLLYFGWFVTSWEDMGGSWFVVLFPGGLALLLWLAAGLLARKARRPE